MTNTENCAGCPFWEKWRLNEQNREFKDLENLYGFGVKIFLERKGDQELNDWSLFK